MLVATRQLGFLRWPTLSSRLLKRHVYAEEERSQNLSLVQKLVLSAPKPIVPYLTLLRMDRPIGSYLLFWPCAWSLALATEAGSIPDVHHLMLFGAGSVIMRGAGCVVNDMWDHKLDRLVERTKNRPLASGALNKKQALALLASQLLLGLGILLQFNWFTVGLGICSLPLVILYPTAKRWTKWPQVILGLTFNWGALMAFGYLDWGIVLPLYIAGLNWTLHYDTIYAHQDRIDDLKAGILSTARTLGENTKLWSTFFSTATIGLIALSGWNVALPWPFYAGLVAASVHLAWQIVTLDINNPKDCGAKFRSNKIFGLIIFVSILLGKIYQYYYPHGVLQTPNNFD